MFKKNISFLIKFMKVLIIVTILSFVIKIVIDNFISLNRIPPGVVLYDTVTVELVNCNKNYDVKFSIKDNYIEVEKINEFTSSVAVENEKNMNRTQKIDDLIIEIYKDDKLEKNFKYIDLVDNSTTLAEFVYNGETQELIHKDINNAIHYNFIDFLSENSKMIFVIGLILIVEVISFLPSSIVLGEKIVSAYAPI